MRADDLAQPFRGIRAPVADPGLLWRARAYAVRMPPEQLFSHTTAAQLLRFRLPDGFREAPLHVTALGDAQPPRVAGVVGHRGAADLPRRTVLDLPVTAPVATWIQLATCLSLDALVEAGDGLVERRRPQARLAEIREAVAAASGVRGVRTLRAALTEMRPGTDSPRETRLRLLVTRAGLPEPIVNAPVVNRFGATIAHVDLGYPEFRVALEYDGAHHFEDATQYREDVFRLDEIMEEGWRVIRVDKNLLARPATLLAKLELALRSHGWTP